MAITQRKLREAVLQLLYSFEVAELPMGDLIPLIMRTLMISRKNALLAVEKAQKVVDATAELDGWIGKASQNYELERITKVDKNILRLALFEHLKENLHMSIVISEAIDLSKKFSTPRASKFVHATLDDAGKLMSNV